MATQEPKTIGEEAEGRRQEGGGRKAHFLALRRVCSVRNQLTVDAQQHLCVVMADGQLGTFLLRLFC